MTQSQRAAEYSWRSAHSRSATWIVFLLSTASGLMTASEMNIATIGPSDVSYVAVDVATVDCAEIAKINLTINIHDVGVEHNDIFYLYQQVQRISKENLDFLFIDQSVTGPGVLDILLSSSKMQYSNVSAITLQRYRNTPMSWCCLTQIWHNQKMADDMEEMDTPRPFSSYWSGSLTRELWSRRPTLEARIIMDIVHAQEWSEVMVIYEELYEEHVRVLTDMAASGHVRCRLVHTSNKHILKNNIIRFFEEADTFHAILISSVDEAKSVLDLTMTLDKSLGKSESVTSTSRWLMFPQDGLIEPSRGLEDTRFDNIAVVADPNNLSPNMGLTWDSGDVMTVTTLMYQKEGRRLSTVGSVSQNWALQLHSPVFPNADFGFNGRRFLITTNTWDPYMYRRVVNGTVEYYGFCMDLAQELSRTLNFTMSWTEPPDGQWGAEGPNGSWTGMVGQVQREDVDMIVAPIGVTGAREKVIDFTFAFFYDDTAVIMKKPDPEKSKWRTYIDIFKKEVLMCIGASLVLGSLMIYLTEWAVRRVYGPWPKTFAVTYSGCVWYLFGAMTNQGGRNIPFSVSGRLFLSGWWLFCLVVVGTYSGNLIAVLTVTKDKPPFNTLAEMASQDDYKFGTLGKSMWTTLFETSSRPEFQAMDKKIKAFAKSDPDVLHLKSDVHLQKVKEGSYAYIADKGLFQTWLAYNCDLMLLKETFYPAKYAIGLPNKSVYTKRISDQVVKIYESGLLQVWIKRWWPKRSFCGGSLLTEARTLNLVDVQSSFYLIGIGAVLGLLLLIFEYVLKKLVPDFTMDFFHRSKQKANKI